MARQFPWIHKIQFPLFLGNSGERKRTESDVDPLTNIALWEWGMGRQIQKLVGVLGTIANEFCEHAKRRKDLQSEGSRKSFGE